MNRQPSLEEINDAKDAKKAEVIMPANEHVYASMMQQQAVLEDERRREKRYKNREPSESSGLTNRQLQRILEAQGMRTGSAQDAILSRSKNFIKWLLNETPESATVCETLVAIAVDAYNEENHDDD